MFVTKLVWHSDVYKQQREWKNLHSEELHNLYSSLNIIRQIKLRRMRWVGHLACMGEERKLYKVFVGSLKERDH
jgi:hypothetical protein